MLTVRFENNSEMVEIFKVFGIDNEPAGTNFVMYDEKTPVAYWQMHIEIDSEPVAVIDKIFFLEGVEEGDKKFFIHAIFFKLIEGTPIKIRVKGIDNSYKQYGFEEVNGNMEVYSKNINLHYMCGVK